MLTLDLGISPSYVLDEMQVYEITALIQHRDLKYREMWEMTRLLGYITAQSHTTKRLKITDIIKFDWDNQKKESDPDTPTTEQINALAEMAKQYEGMFTTPNYQNNDTSK